jgi:hypothetical protein
MFSKVRQLLANDFKCEIHLVSMKNVSQNNYSSKQSYVLKFVELNLFINHFHFLLNPPIPH